MPWLILCCYSKICGTSKLIFEKEAYLALCCERENPKSCQQHILGIWSGLYCSITARWQASHGKTCRWTRVGLVGGHQCYHEGRILTTSYNPNYCPDPPHLKMLSTHEITYHRTHEDYVWDHIFSALGCMTPWTTDEGSKHTDHQSSRN